MFSYGGSEYSVNCETVANNGVRKASSRISTQTGAMTTVSSSIRVAETGSKKTEDMNLQNFSIVALEV